MNWGNVYRILKSDYLILLPIMVLAFYITFIPHLNYPYPVHLDEWTHLANAKQIVRQASAFDVTNPVSGGQASTNQVYEVGFILPLAIFHQVSGIPWLTVFRYFPSIIFMVTVLSVYILGRRQGFGWEAALVTCLIPTTVGVLGPALMVPLAMGLMFIPPALFVALNFRTIWSYVVLLFFFVFLITLHGPTAVVLVIILVPYILLSLRGDLKHALAMVLTLAIPFVISLPWTWSMLLPRLTSLLTTSHVLKTFLDYPRLFRLYSYPVFGLCLLGTGLLAIRGGKRDYGLILGLLAMSLMLFIFYTFHYGVPVLYERGIIPMMLMMSIVAGAGLGEVRKLRLPSKLGDWIKVPLITRNIGNIFGLALIGIILTITIPMRQDAPYYHMIDDEDYRAFVWIAENVDERYEKAILDPWKGTAFVAITGKYVHTRIAERASASDAEAYKFLKGGSSNTTFLWENGISIIYTHVYEGEQAGVIDYRNDNPDLVEVAKNIYLLKEAEKLE
ncbi:hypothetical protein ACFLUU_06495 [Chloroflexota bacterium]